MTGITRRARRLNARLRIIDERFGAILNVVFGAAGVAVGVALLALAIRVGDQAEMGVQACERSRDFGPYLARDYARRDVLPPEQQRRYEQSIPRRC